MTCPAIFPRCRDRHLSPYRRNRERHGRIKTSQLRSRSADVDDTAAPVRLDDDQRLAQIDHAVAAGWQPWEIAQLVPGPVTAAERARVTG
jgi:hypothetical protein